MNDWEVKKRLEDNNLSWADFQKWMIGQTITVLENGESEYYDWDVNLYIHFKLKKQEPPIED